MRKFNEIIIIPCNICRPLVAINPQSQPQKHFICSPIFIKFRVLDIRNCKAHIRIQFSFFTSFKKFITILDITHFKSENMLSRVAIVLLNFYSLFLC